MAFPDDLLERNLDFAAGRDARPLPPVEAIPLAVVACYDPRLDPLLEPALGVREGQIFLFRAAGAVVRPDTGLLRSLAMAVYMFDVRQVLVLGHSSCRMAQFTTSQFIDTFRARGVRRDAFGDGDLRAWAGAVPSPRDGVLGSVAAIAEAPFLPSDLEIAGAILDDASGEIELVVRPGEQAAVRNPETAPEDAPSEDEGAPEAPAAVVVPPPPSPAPPPGTQPTFEALRSVVEILTSDPGLRAARDELVRALRSERHPLRQLAHLQAFVKKGAGDTHQVRAALDQVRKALHSQPQTALAGFLLPILERKG